MVPRLLHVFSTFAPGGPEVRTASFINATHDCFKHYIIAMDGRYGALSRLDRHVAVEVLPPPPIVPDAMGYLPAPLRAPAVVWRLFRNAVWALGQLDRVQPDLMLTYNLGAASVLLAAQMRAFPVIHAEAGFNADEASRLKRSRVVLRRLATRRVSTLVVPSRSLERIASSALGLRMPVVRIANGVEVGRLQPTEGGAMRRRLGLEPRNFVIGCVGHLRAEKGHLRLLDAFRLAAIPESKLLLVGDGPMRPILEKASAATGMASSVIFAGSVDDVAPWYSAMDVFALASDTEQMPVALLEAMACGLPAVTTDVGDCRDILGQQLIPAVVAAHDVGGMAAALRSFSRDEHLRRETGRRNHHRCAQEYDCRRMFEAYTALYLRTITGRRERASSLRSA